MCCRYNISGTFHESKGILKPKFFLIAPPYRPTIRLKIKLSYHDPIRIRVISPKVSLWKEISYDTVRLELESLIN